MQAVAGQQTTVTLADRLDETGIGVQVETPVQRDIVVAWQPATLDGTWTVTLDGLPHGDYQLVWRTGTPSSVETFVPLIVFAQADDEPAEATDWTPTVQDVADLCQAFTRPPVQEGAGNGTFDDTTDPTAAQVTRYIATAVEEVSGRVGVAIPERCVGLARVTATWHAAATVESERDPAGADETDGARGWKWSSYTASLKELISQARPGALRLA